MTQRPEGPGCFPTGKSLTDHLSPQFLGEVETRIAQALGIPGAQTAGFRVVSDIPRTSQLFW